MKTGIPYHPPYWLATIVVVGFISIYSRHLIYFCTRSDQIFKGLKIRENCKDPPKIMLYIIKLSYEVRYYKSTRSTLHFFCSTSMKQFEPQRMPFSTLLLTSSSPPLSINAITIMIVIIITPLLSTLSVLDSVQPIGKVSQRQA